MKKLFILAVMAIISSAAFAQLGMPYTKKQSDALFLKSGVADTTFVKFADGFELRDSVYFKTEVDNLLKYTARRLETITNARIDHTGTTSETTLETITIPAGSIGPNGLIEFEIVSNGTNSANNKITRLKDQSGNVLWSSAALTTNPNIRVKIFVANRNSLTSQVSGNIVIFGSSQPTTSNVIATTHNSANGLTFTITGQLGSASEHLYIEYKSVFVTHGGN